MSPMGASLRRFTVDVGWTRRCAACRLQEHHSATSQSSCGVLARRCAACRPWKSRIRSTAEKLPMAKSDARAACTPSAPAMPIPNRAHYVTYRACNAVSGYTDTRMTSFYNDVQYGVFLYWAAKWCLSLDGRPNDVTL